MIPRAARIDVLAGVNGSGKSSIGGAALRQSGSHYFNPDEAAAQMLRADPEKSAAEANGMAWQLGRALLERAIQQRQDFRFETTLGGHSITRLLQEAAASGLELHLWYVGLDSVERHLDRVARRVRCGGHDIPEKMIRQRWDASRLNLIRLLPCLTRLRMFDNSDEADFTLGEAPSLRLVLAMERGQVVGPADFAGTPEWAKPIVAAAWQLAVGKG